MDTIIIVKAAVEAADSAKIQRGTPAYLAAIGLYSYLLQFGCPDYYSEVACGRVEEFFGISHEDMLSALDGMIAARFVKGRTDPKTGVPEFALDYE